MQSAVAALMNINIFLLFVEHSMIINKPTIYTEKSGSDSKNDIKALIHNTERFFGFYQITAVSR